MRTHAEEKQTESKMKWESFKVYEKLFLVAKLNAANERDATAGSNLFYESKVLFFKTKITISRFNF